MSVPALRRPKALAKVLIAPEKEDSLPKKQASTGATKTEQNLIVTLKEGTKFVLTRDAFNGILTEGSMYKCVLCAAEMELDAKLKEVHVKSSKHVKAMENFNFSDDFPGNMIRQVNNESFYCTVCNVVVSDHYITRHVNNAVHGEELSKAVKKTLVYKPVL